MQSRRRRNRLVEEIGNVTEAHISTSAGTHPTRLAGTAPASPVPTTLDWDLWLGNRRPRPFSDYYISTGRGFLDFGTGQIGNWATRTTGPVQTALQLDAPTSLESIAEPGKEQPDVPEPCRSSPRLPGRVNDPP